MKSKQIAIDQNIDTKKIFNDYSYQDFLNYIKQTQYLESIYPGQTFDFNRRNDGYTDPSIFYSHEIFPLNLYKKLTEENRWGEIVLKELSFKIFRFDQLPINRADSLGLIDDKSKTIIIPIDFLEYIRFGSVHRGTKKAEQLSSEFLLSLLYRSQLVKSTLNQNNFTYDKSTELRNLEKLYLNELLKQKKLKLPLRIEQISMNVKSGAFDENALKIIEALQKARERSTNLAVFQELVVTAYHTKDKVSRSEFLQSQAMAIKKINTFQRYAFNEEFSQTISQNLSEKLDEHDLHNFLNELNDYIRQLDENDLENENLFYRETDYGKNKRELLIKFINKRLIEMKVLDAKEIIETIQKNYDKSGIAVVLPAAIPSNQYSKPFNGAYCFRADGTVAMIVEKQRLADDPSSYFFEKHYFEPGDPNNKYVFVVNGHKIGVFVCEDIWQENGQYTGRKLIQSQGGKLLDRNLANNYSINTAAEIIVNVSASPKQIAYLIPQSLKTLDWESLPDDLVIMENMSFLFKEPRSDVRELVIQEVSKKLNAPVLYVNSLQGIDDVVMTGASYLADRKGKIRATSKQFEESTMGVMFTEHSEMTVDENNKRNHILSPEDQAIKAITLSIQDYLEKSGISIAYLRNDGTAKSLLLQKIMKQVVKNNRGKIVKRLIRDLQLIDGNMNLRKASNLVYKNIDRNTIGIKTFVMPTFSITAFRELFIGLVSALKSGSDIQVNAVLFPQTFLPSSSLWQLPVFSAIFWWVGLVNILMQIVSNYIFWPIVNKVKNIIIDPFIKRATRTQITDMVNQYATDSGSFSQVRSRIPVEFARAELSKETNRQNKLNNKRSFVDWWIKKSSHIETLFINNISILRSYVIGRDMNRRDAQGKKAILIGNIDDSDKLRGKFTSGGVELGGFNPLHSVSKSSIQLLYLYSLKKDMAQIENPFRWNVQAWWMNRYLKTLAIKKQNDNLWRKLLSLLPYNNLSRLNQHELIRYKLNVWQSIKQMTENEQIRQRITKIIDKLIKKDDKTPNSSIARRNPDKKTEYSKLKWKFRPTRMNNVSENYMLSLFDRILTTKDIREFVFKKKYFDPDDQYDWQQYAHYLTYNIVRHESTLHKNQGILGPILNLNTSGSHLEIRSGHVVGYDSIYERVSSLVESYKSIEVANAYELENLIKISKSLILLDGKDHWVERDYEIHQIEKAIENLKIAKKGNSYYPLLIINNLTNYTDKIAAELAMNKGIQVVAVVLRRDLKDMKIPRNTEMFKFFIFDTGKEKKEFISKIINKHKVSTLSLAQEELQY